MRFVCLILLLVSFAPRALAQDAARHEGGIEGGEPRLVAELVVARRLITGHASRDRAVVRAGVRFELDPDWHVYWKNPGQSGLATEVTLRSPGLTWGELQWPMPQRLVSRDGFITTFGYERETLLFAEASGPVEATGEIEATIDYLVCKVDCIPGRATLRAPIPTTGDATPFQRFAPRVPRAASAAGIDASLSGPALARGDAAVMTLTLRDRGGAALQLASVDVADAFFPERIDTISIVPRSVRAASGAIEIALDLRSSADVPSGPSRLRAAIDLVRSGVAAPISIDLPIERSTQAVIAPPAVEAPRESSRRDPDVPLGLALLLGLLGGLVLNLMPCVLPVLALKAASLAELGHASRGEAMRQSLGYALGVIATMLALAGLTVLLRAAGTPVGWGFQFQEPLFIVVLAAVLVAFAMNLFGVFEIGTSATTLAQIVDRRQGFSRSVGEGVLAVVLATPCSAPFLGTALGFAFASGALVSFAVFTAIGVGLAAPYVLLAAIPGAQRILPKPGKWMTSLRALFGFALLGTVVWLVWLLGRLTSADGIAIVLSLLLAVALASFAYGASSSLPTRTRVLVRSMPLLFVAALGLAASSLPDPETIAATPTSYRSFDPSAVRATIEDGKAVFVYFTADWCVTCKVNERNVLADDDVVREMERLAVVGFRGDYTRRDDQIRRELERHGRAGVPLYLLYPPNAPDDPRVLPELLTVDGMLAELRALR